MNRGARIELGISEDISNQLRDKLFYAGFLVAMSEAVKAICSIELCGASISSVSFKDNMIVVYIYNDEYLGFDELFTSMGHICSSATLEFNRAFSAYTHGLFLGSDIDDTFEEIISFATRGAVFIPNLILERG